MEYYRQSCNSYFVESHDDREKRFRDELRERELHAKRETQLAIAEELSELASYEYRDDILEHMGRMETETLPDVASIDIQTEIQWFMRPYLLDFLIEAHNAFGLLPDTLFLTINLLDRYCSKRVVYKKHYQLVGCSALLIAAKTSDKKERVPTIKELKAMCCGLYEDDMFTQMEWHVLATLNWVLGHPTIDSFMQMAVDHVQYDPEVEHMARYISEIAMFLKEFVSKRPSDMAHASLVLARCILGRQDAVPADWASKYDPKTLVNLAQALHRPSQILSNKYATAHLSRVSIILEDFLARQASMSRYYAPPPTPPSETGAAGFGESLHHKGIPVTPTKQYLPPNTNNGCPTPPITPTNQEYYTGHNAGIGSILHASIPASLNSYPSNQQCVIPCILSPISQLAPIF